MKKFTVLTVICVVLTLVLTSCITSVGVRSWVPSEIDLTGYKTVAIQTSQPAKTYYGYRMYIPLKYTDDGSFTVAEEAKRITSTTMSLYNSNIESVLSNVIASSFDSSIYNVVSPRQTDSIINEAKKYTLNGSVRQALLRQNVDLFVSSSIDSMNYDEYIDPKKMKTKDGQEFVAYYLKQQASIAISYILQDVQTTAVVGSDKLSDLYPLQQYSLFDIWQPQYKETVIATANLDGTGFKMVNNEVLSAENIFKMMIRGFEEEIYNAVSPSQKLFHISLKNDPNKSETMKNAKDLVSRGMYQAALEIYNQVYAQEKLFEAGYNRAVVTYAIGQRDQAINLAYELWNTTYNPEAMKLYERLDSLNKNQTKAISQITNTDISNADLELMGF